MFNLLVIVYSAAISVQGLNVDQILLNSQATKYTKDVILKYKKSRNNNLKCVEQLDLFLENLEGNHTSGINDDWALQMVDASAKIPSGITEANFIWLGRYDQCLNILNSEKNIRGKYCLVTATFNGSEAVATLEHPFERSYMEYRGILDSKKGKQQFVTAYLGICLPSQCMEVDVQKAFDIALPAPWNAKCQTKESVDKPLDVGAIITICYFGVFIILLTASTMYDLLTNNKKQHPLLLSFSIRKNSKKLFSYEKQNVSEDFLCVHGMQFISIIWVIAGHHSVARFLLEPLSNFKDMISFSSRIESMIFVNALNSVDTFFVIFGMLVIFGFMKMKHEGKKLNIGLFYLHRYLRFSSIVIPNLLATIFLTKYVGDGPFYPDVDDIIVEPCRKYWWLTLLYIQNYTTNEFCLISTWYLNVDWQLYLISPIFLYLLSKWTKIGIGLMFCCIISSIVSSFVVTWNLRLVAVTNSRFTNMYTFMILYYSVTHHRAANWLIGGILGYLLAKIKFQKDTIFKKIPKWVIIMLWVITLIAMPVCVLVGTDRLLDEVYHPYDHAAYNALSRPAWGLCVAWVIFACSSGSGGYINTFLSLPVFQILSRIVFSMSMLHLNILFIVSLMRREPTYFTVFDFLYSFWGGLTASLAVSVFWVLAFEYPASMIEKYFLGEKNRENIKDAPIETKTPCAKLQNFQNVNIYL